MLNKTITYAPVPNFGQLTEYITQAPDIDGFYGVVINKIPITQHDLENKLTLEALKADYQKIVTIFKRPASLLPTKELNKLKADYAIGTKLVYPIEVLDSLLQKVSIVKEPVVVVKDIIK